jgi:hypothetical protein
LIEKEELLQELARKLDHGHLAFELAMPMENMLEEITLSM